jgi:bifunctional oligoribonuclease and PAP phosphatase NrnA
MIENFQAAKTLIEKSQTILLTTHERTDGDDLGSVLALAHYLTSVGKSASVVVTGGVPSRLDFLPGSDEVEEEIKQTNFDLLIVSGCSVLNRVNNPAIEALNIPKINFDHHPDNQLFANVNVVDHTKSAVAELMYDFLQWAQWPISEAMATCLLTGIVTDTGLLMHNNTQASTLAAAGELMKQGAVISNIAKHTFAAQSDTDMRAWGAALESAYYNPENKMIYAVITQEQLAKLGQPELASFEGLVETLNKVPEAKFAMFLKEDGDRVKGSLRSEEYKGVDVQTIAQQLGGGGHKLAAGFSMFGKLAKTAEGRWEVV